jgi:hypothetical protein
VHCEGSVVAQGLESRSIGVEVFNFSNFFLMAEAIASEFSFLLQRQPSAASRFHPTDGTPVVLKRQTPEVKGTNQRLKRDCSLAPHIKAESP